MFLTGYTVVLSHMLVRSIQFTSFIYVFCFTIQKSEKTRRKVRPAISKEGLNSTMQQRMSLMAEVLNSKEERLTNQKKRYSLVDLDSLKNYSGDTKELNTIDVKRLHNPTDQLNKELSANAQLPQNVIKELNLVFRKNRKDQNECL